MKKCFLFLGVTLMLNFAPVAQAQLFNPSKVYVIKTVVPAAQTGTNVASYAAGDTVYWASNPPSKPYGFKGDAICPVIKSLFDFSKTEFFWTIESTLASDGITYTYKFKNNNFGAGNGYIVFWGNYAQSMYLGTGPVSLTVTAATDSQGKACFNVSALTNDGIAYLSNILQLKEDWGNYAWNMNTTKGTVTDIPSIYIQEPVAPVATATDKAPLLTAIAAANGVYNSSAEGTSFGQYTTENKSAFASVISNAQKVYDSSTSMIIDVTASILSLKNATTTFKNSVNVSVNSLIDGLYYVTITDGTNDFYLTDAYPHLLPPGGNSQPTKFIAKIATDTLYYQQFKFTKEGNSRFRIESKYRLDNPLTFTKSYLNENGSFGGNDYNSDWNSMSLSFDGTHYAIQKGGPAGNTYWYPSSYTSGGNVNNNTTNGVNISENLVFKIIAVPAVTTNNDITLSNITLSKGVLTPVFNAATTSYNVVLQGGTTTVTATAIKNDAGQVVTGDGVVDLSSGSGKSTIVVTASDGTTIRTYTINYSVTTVSTTNSAMSFPGGNDGINSNVTLPAFNLTSLPFTIEMLVKPATDMGEYGTIFGNRVGSPCLLYFDPTNVPNLNFYWDGVHDGVPSAPAIFGTWHHIALVVTATTSTIYVDGIPTSKTGSFTNNVLAANSFLGWDPLSAPNQFRTFKGLMDEVRIWNVERTAQQLQDNKGVTLTGKEAGLVGYWNFDDQLSEQSTDVTGNGFNGINHGTTYEASFDKSDATLSALSASLGAFDMVFAPDIVNYNVVVPAGTTSVTVNGIVASAILGATLNGTGIIDVTGVNPKAVVIVTAPNKTTTKTYTLNFTITTDNNSNLIKNIFATTSGNQVLVNGTKSGDLLKVYNVSGQLVNQAIAKSDKTSFTLTSGIYFIKVNAVLLKVIL